jgi:toxin ParE1/3/4
MSFNWRIQQTDQVEVDLISIYLWTANTFGKNQAEKYIETITSAIEALVIGPYLQGSKARDDIGQGIRLLHVQRKGKKGRHFVMFKPMDDQTILVIRLLHDRADLTRDSLELMNNSQR